MYYILNETNQIIAADKNLLELCGLSHIDELSLNIALGDTKFDSSETNITITTGHDDKTFPVSKTSLSSMLGHITLVEIQAEEEKAQEDDLSLLTLNDTVENIAPLEIEETSEEKEVAIDDNELFDLATEEETENIAPLEIEETSEETEVAIEEDNELFDLVTEEETESIIETVEEPLDTISEDTDILDLGLSRDEDIVLTTEEPVSEEQTEIVVDIDKVCQQIGISHEDYDTFLNEYIDTALGLEQDLQSEDSTKRSNAVATLSHLGEVLQLPVIGDIIAKIDAAPANELKETVESFYAALSRITTKPTSQAETKIDLFEIESEKEAEPAEAVSEKGFGTISLEGIKPLHFDFQLEEAANDLSLPVELIEEFVHDFIEQCHVETKNMLKAYEEGDLDAIQKIGHLLKGAASNLRINPLADTLYKIQFCEDSSDLEHLIKDYWGHFLSFEIQINALAK